jgi:hypothetical protein
MSIKLEKISPSSLMQYEKCPRLFYYSTLLGLKLPQSMIHLEFGTGIHAAIDEIYKERNSDGSWKHEDTPDKAKAIFANHFRTKYLETLDSIERNTMLEKYNEMVDDGLNIIQEFWDTKEKFLTVNGIDMVDFELIRKHILFNPETKEPWPIPLSYRIDGIAKNDIVIEYKTSSKPYDIFETRASLQALSYALGRYCETGKIPLIYYIVMIKKRKKDKIQMLRIQYQISDLMLFDAKVRSMLKSIHAGEFDKPLKGHEFFCDCKKYEEMLDYKDYI